MSAGPTMRRRQLGAALRRLRNDAGLGAEAAAEELDCARTKISHIETGRSNPGKTELKALLDLYGAPPEVYATLEGLRKEANERGWWSTFRLPQWFQVYVGLEADAMTMRSFDGEVIPGLMQTEDYNRATQEAAAHFAKGAEIDRLVEARRRRALRLTSDNALSLRAVISEAALQRALGLGTVGVEQLRHLVTLGARDNVSLHVIPLDAGLHASLGGSFALLSFDGDVAPPVAYQEYAAGGQVVDDQDIVANLSEAWEKLRSQTLTHAESIVWIERMLEGHDHGEGDHD